MRSCEQCGTGNDDTRVYCSNCGTRLPELPPAGSSAPVSKKAAGQPVAAPSAGATAPPLPGGFRKRPSASSAPQGKSALGVVLSNLLWCALIAALLAGAIQIFRAPDDIPPVQGINTAAAKETFSTLRELAASQKSDTWTLNAKAINQFLETAIESQPGNSGRVSLLPEFQRALVRLHSGSLTLVIEEKILGRNLYLQLDILPEAKAGGLEARSIGGAIGRLPVHPVLLPAFTRLFAPTVSALSQALDLLKRAQSVTITPDDATFQWPGIGNSQP